MGRKLTEDGFFKHGRYEGEHVEEVAMEDQDYLSMLLEDDDSGLDALEREAIETALQNVIE